MKRIKKNVNIEVATAAAIILLIGIVITSFDAKAQKYAFISNLLFNVSGSVFATAVANWVLTRQLIRLPLQAILEALSPRTQLVRINQNATLEFSFDGDDVKVIKSHSYTLSNPGRKVFTHFSMFTDSVSWMHKRKGRFTRIDGPYGQESLSGDALENQVSTKEGKLCFEKDYTIYPGDEAKFTFISEEFYRKADRLIWTVEDLSEDFKVTIINRTPIKDSFRIKIHHQDAARISPKPSSSNPKITDREEIHFTFDTEILPYQGFEVMWDLDPSDDERGEKASVKRHRTKG